MRSATEAQKAYETAMQLVKDTLTPEQMEGWKYNGKFNCIGNSTGRTYIVTQSGGIFSNGWGYCLIFKNTYDIVPAEYNNTDLDRLGHERAIAAKLMIECDEKLFLLTARR